MGALDLQRVEQAERVGGEVGDRERQLRAAGAAHATIVVDDALEVRLQRARNGRPQVRWVALIPWISSIGSPAPARS